MIANETEPEGRHPTATAPRSIAMISAGTTGKANELMSAFAKACRDRDVLPLVLANRVHIAPPLSCAVAR
ncbi:hypothetical protein ALI22I_26870 [Saccharothrix sp. ALI-22-I]|uniref:hypothetical protein n=1 Tax=Saccharothrix sp. ALI-22-I TaxID=1933778 RepID=UPI00097C9B3A|nr:hypothetical protein [Saccharothrix sp. ALI-22-I]ONI85437.1 hypothetical protein ALI22I_26870 [Saccharothrix sp. ALI-22-I]